MTPKETLKSLTKLKEIASKEFTNKSFVVYKDYIIQVQYICYSYIISNVNVYE